MRAKVPTKNPNSKLFEACDNENRFISRDEEKEKTAVKMVALIFAIWMFLGSTKATNHIEAHIRRIGNEIIKDPPHAVAIPLPPLKFIQGEKQCANTAAFKEIISNKNSSPTKVFTNTTLINPLSKSIVKTESPIHFDFETLKEFRVPTFPEPADLMSISL